MTTLYFFRNFSPEAFHPNLIFMKISNRSVHKKKLFHLKVTLHWLLYKSKKTLAMIFWISYTNYQPR